MYKFDVLRVDFGVDVLNVTLRTSYPGKMLESVFQTMFQVYVPLYTYTYT